jgi:hypothetical protein
MTSPPWRLRSRTQHIKGCNPLGELRLGGKTTDDYEIDKFVMQMFVFRIHGIPASASENVSVIPLRLASRQSKCFFNAVEK